MNPGTTQPASRSGSGPAAGTYGVHEVRRVSLIVSSASWTVPSGVTTWSALSRASLLTWATVRVGVRGAGRKVVVAAYPV